MAEEAPKGAATSAVAVGGKNNRSPTQTEEAADDTNVRWSVGVSIAEFATEKVAARSATTRARSGGQGSASCISTDDADRVSPSAPVWLSWSD